MMYDDHKTNKDKAMFKKSTLISKQNSDVMRQFMLKKDSACSLDMNVA
jgi:hypothetical protein